jgi:hypothetical protein
MAPTHTATLTRDTTTDQKTLPRTHQFSRRGHRTRPTSSFRQNTTATTCVALSRKGEAPSIAGGTTFQRFAAMLCEARLRFDVSRRLAPRSGLYVRSSVRAVRAKVERAA